MTPLCPPRGGPGRDDPPGGPGTWVLTLETQAPLLPLGTGLSSLLPEPKTGFQFHNPEARPTYLSRGVCPEFQITVHSPCLIPTHTAMVGIFKTFKYPVR